MTHGPKALRHWPRKCPSRRQANATQSRTGRQQLSGRLRERRARLGAPAQALRHLPCLRAAGQASRIVLRHHVPVLVRTFRNAIAAQALNALPPVCNASNVSPPRTFPFKLLSTDPPNHSLRRASGLYPRIDIVETMRTAAWQCVCTKQLISSANRYLRVVWPSYTAVALEHNLCSPSHPKARYA